MANVFPRWVNTIPIKVVIALGLVVSAVALGVTYYFTPKYTRVGTAASSQEDKGCELGKGWTNEGIEWFNTLFDKVKADWKANPSFIRTWIAKERVQLKEQTKETNKQYEDIPKACHELVSNSDDDTSSQMTKRQWTREEMETSCSLLWKPLQEPIPSDDDDLYKCS